MKDCGVTFVEWLVILGIIALIILATFGCASRTISYGGATYRSDRFFLKENFSTLTVTNPDGMAIRLDGYSADANAPEIHLPYGVKVIPKKEK